MLVSLLLDAYVSKSLAFALVTVFGIHVEVMRVEIRARRVYAQAPIAPSRTVDPTHTLTKMASELDFWILDLLLYEGGWLNIAGGNPCHCSLQSCEKKLAMKRTTR